VKPLGGLGVVFWQHFRDGFVVQRHQGYDGRSALADAQVSVPGADPADTGKHRWFAASLRAVIRAKRDRGEKLDTEIPNSMMRCVCGVVFDSHDPEGSLPHRRHIYAAQGEQKR
jgi:hypothetical protein